MTPQALVRLAKLIESEREHVLAQWRSQVRELPSAKDLEIPELNDHVPVLLDELAWALRQGSDETIPQALVEGSPPVHGLQRYRDGFDIVEVVAEYNILRGCIHDLALGSGIELVGRPFHILNRILDEAIGLAVQMFSTQQALAVQRRREEHLAFVAHDLRSPLNAISIAAHVLERLIPDQPERADTLRMLKMVHRNAQHLQSLVESILKESENIGSDTRIRVERRDFELWPLVESLLHDLQPVAETATTTLVNLVPDELAVFADASLVKRVFQNLVTNAIKFTPRGEVRIGAAAIDDGVECWVTDTGMGIAEDELATLFHRDEGARREAGTGLGLGIVRSFVEAHGGTVTATSAPGSGSTFRFTLPSGKN